MVSFGSALIFYFDYILTKILFQRKLFNENFTENTDESVIKERLLKYFKLTNRKGPEVSAFLLTTVYFINLELMHFTASSNWNRTCLYHKRNNNWSCPHIIVKEITLSKLMQDISTFHRLTEDQALPEIQTKQNKSTHNCALMVVSALDILEVGIVVPAELDGECPFLFLLYVHFQRAHAWTEPDRNPRKTWEGARYVNWWQYWFNILDNVCI